MAALLWWPCCCGRKVYVRRTVDDVQALLLWPCCCCGRVVVVAVLLLWPCCCGRKVQMQVLLLWLYTWHAIG